MPLKRKFTIVIMACLTINFLLLMGIFRILVVKHPPTTDLVESQLLSTAEKEGISISSEDLHILISKTFNTSEITDTASYLIIQNMIKISLILLVILLVGILYFIHREICKPIEKLSHAINNINHQNGYFITVNNKNEIKTLSSNFYLMAEQIEINKQKKDQLISYITHDIRTPLTSISGYTQRLIAPGISDSSKRVRYYQTILSKANDIKFMVEELENYAITEIQEINLEEVMLVDFFNHLLDEYEDELSTYDIYLHKHIDLSSSFTWKIDKKRVQRIFSNIFTNAISHGNSLTQIHFYAYTINDTLYINIENNGHELEDDQYDKVFELMYQGDSARTSNKHQGKGLGLTIVRQMIIQHGGTVNAYKPCSGGFGLAMVLPKTF